jgi:hypothetical protein
MSKNLVLLVIVIIALVAGAYFLLPRQSAVQTEPQVSEMTIVLSQYSESGQEGTATLTDVNGQLRVVLDLSGYDSDVPQPAHIHTGNCPRIGPVIHTLSDVVDNHSETTLDTTLDGLLASNETLNINVHESYDNFATYTSCGDLQ